MFRPLDDGTLTDADDEAGRPSRRMPGCGVAHDSNLAPNSVAAWQAHLADYEVTPLFQQFGKGSFELPDEQANGPGARRLQGAHGRGVRAARPRRRSSATSAGRPRTAAGSTPTTSASPRSGIEARSAFSGNGLPEENRTVALTRSRFRRHGAGGRQLGDAAVGGAAILLSEAWNDLRLIAADGLGLRSRLGEEGGRADRATTILRAPAEQAVRRRAGAGWRPTTPPDRPAGGCRRARCALRPR